MDLQMPIMDGFEASKRIRKFTFDTPIIALSAAVMKEDLKMTQEAGMNEHLAKPIDIEKLKAVLIKYLETSIKEIANTENEIISEEFEDLIDGVNKEELFHRLNNDKELSYKILINFANDKKDIVKELDSINIESNEFNSLMHNLKGLSGNLSLTDVYKYSTEIYTSDNLENKIALLPKLKESLTIVIESINKKASSKIENKKNISNFSKDEILNDIKKLNHDTKEGVFITQDRKNLVLEQVRQISNKEIAMKLDTYLSKYDYNHTQIILEKIIGELS
jgi:CheY-like chemotaxis protein